MSDLTLYTQPNCTQCEQTKRFLDTRKIDYSVVDITEDKEGYEKVIGLGYKSVPVVMFGDEHWSGFKFDRLMAIVNSAHKPLES